MVRKKQPSKNDLAASDADIAGRKQAEEALLRMTQLNREVISGVQEGIVVYDLQMCYVLWNPFMEALTGIPASDILGKYCLDVFPHLREQGVDRLIELALAGETVRSPDTKFHSPATGLSGWVVGIYSPHHNADGEIIGVIATIRNITKRKLAEDALQNSEDRLRFALDCIETGAWDLDLIDHTAYRSLKHDQIFGYETMLPQWTFEMFLEHVVPEDRAEVNRKFQHAVESKGDWNFECRITRRDGEQRWILASGRHRFDPSGQPRRMAGIVQDITRRKQVEQALQEIGERYQRITEGLTDYYYTVRLQDGQVVGTTHGPACKVVTGYTEKNFADNPNLWINMVVPEDRELVIGHVQRILAGENIQPMEHRIVRKDGQVRWISDTPVLEFDDQGKLVSYDGVIKDITDRKQVEKELKNSEEKFRTLYENAPVMIDAFDNRGRCTMWNQECQKMFGWSIDEINAHDDPLALFYPDPDIRREVIDTVTSQPGNIFREWHPVTKDGKELTVLWANFQLPDGTVINIGHDITDRIRLEKEQQKVEKLESIGILAAGIAHNFNNILTVVLGNISLAKMDAMPGSEIHEVLDQAEKASLRAKDLTAQLLTFSKGGAPVKNIASLTELLKDTAISALRGSNVKCQFSIPADLRQAEIDAGQVSLVIYNLALNAQQAMPAGGTIELKAENITISATQYQGKELMLEAGDYIRITVTDHGSGIAEQNMSKIFDPFFTTKIKAVGLGLATSFSIVRRHGGHISVDSKAGAGSTVYVYLPVAGKSS